MKAVLSIFAFITLTNGFNDTIDESDEKYAIALENDIRLYVTDFNALNDHKKLWPNGIVNYKFDSSISSYKKSLIESTMNQMSQQIGIKSDGKKCITFKSRSTEKNYLQFVSDKGCWSYIGMIGGMQKISIGNDCDRIGTIMHEIMHALGFYHEHQRPDRDKYLNIHFENVKSTELYNFDIKNSSQILSEFDYDSIMIYRNKAFSKNNKNTITAKNGMELKSSHEKVRLTKLNIKAIKNLYKCSNVTTNNNNKKQKNILDKVIDMIPSISIT